MTKRWPCLVICMCFLALLFLTPGNSRAEGEKKTDVQKGYGEAEKADGKFQREKEEFERKTREKIEKLDGQIKELEVKVKEAGSRAKAEAKEGLRELKGKRATLKRDMEKLRASGAKGWKYLKRKVEHSVEEIEKGYEKVRDKVGSE